MLELFTIDAWQQGGLLGSLALAFAVVVSLLLVVMLAARRLETNSDAARRAWSGGIDDRSMPKARVVLTRRPH